MLFTIFFSNPLYCFSKVDNQIFVSTKTENNSNESSNEIYKLMEEAYKYLDIAPSKAIKFGNQAYELSLEHQNIEYQRESLKILGFSFYYLGDFENSLNYFLEAHQISNEMQNQEYLSEDYNNLGIVYSYLHDFKKALEFHNKSLLIERRKGNREEIATSLGNIAITYKKMGHYEKALEAMFASQDIAKELKEEDLIAMNHNTIANIYLDLKFYEKAIQFHNEALKIFKKLDDKRWIALTYNNLAVDYSDMKNYEKAYQYMNLYINLCNEIEASELLGMGYLNRGKIYTEQMKYDSALTDLQMAKKYYREYKNKSNTATALNSIGTIYFKLGKYYEAKKYFEEALDEADSDFFEVFQEAYKYLADIHKGIGDSHTAEQYELMHAIVSDTISNRSKLSKITDLIIEYEILHKQREVEHLKRENEIKQLKINQQIYFRIFISIIIFIMLVTGFIIYIKYRKEAKLKKEINIQNHRLELTIQDLNDTKLKLEKALEDEKIYSEMKTRFISMVSHEYKTPITIIQLSTDILIKHFPQLPTEEIYEYLNKVIDNTHKMTAMMNEVLEMSRTQSKKYKLKLQPVELISICNSILNDYKQVDNKNHRIVFENELKSYMINSDANVLNRIISNLISNAIKFSPSNTTITLSLFVNTQKRKVKLVVKDEGIGIPKSEQDKIFSAFYRTKNASKISGTGLGLSIVSDYVELLEGTIDFVSEENKGTTFTIEFPYTS